MSASLVGSEMCIRDRYSWSAKISPWACSRRVASDCDWALNSDRAWVISSWTADLSLIHI
eukprot:9077535-Alexandrium_andersonii.AAC.1